jgi:hypothetical protein
MGLAGTSTIGSNIWPRPSPALASLYTPSITLTALRPSVPTPALIKDGIHVSLWLATATDALAARRS